MEEGSGSARALKTSSKTFILILKATRKQGQGDRNVGSVL